MKGEVFTTIGELNAALISQGVKTPSHSEICETILADVNGTMKTSEIVYKIMSMIPVDEELARQIASDGLKELEKNGMAIHVSQGFWRIRN